MNPFVLHDDSFDVELPCGVSVTIRKMAFGAVEKARDAGLKAAVKQSKDFKDLTDFSASADDDKKPKNSEKEEEKRQDAFYAALDTRVVMTYAVLSVAGKTLKDLGVKEWDAVLTEQVYNELHRVCVDASVTPPKSPTA